MVYSDDRVPGTETLAAKRRLASHFSFKMEHECSEMYVFVRERVSLAIETPKSLLLLGPQNKEVHIRK